ncbi:MAG TPA: type II 3-dehydroquinate dehydratase, partial [Gemmatimonadaceae bacterium]|nr:type II 3-dehydroquinate dehydratase [Gemmatimonadaceae bacterium]
MRIAVINGPNLNLLGTREPALYGTETLADIESHLLKVAKELGVELTFSQHNGEGEIVDEVQRLRGSVDGALVNAGAYSHTSLAIRDALAGVKIPFVEVHLTNIYAREPERRRSARARQRALAARSAWGPSRASVRRAQRARASSLRARRAPARRR